MFASRVTRNVIFSLKCFPKGGSTRCFSYVPIEPKHFPDVVKHLETFFYTDAPLSRASGASLPNGNPDWEAYVRSSLEEKLSLMAITKSGEIAGLMLNGILQRSARTHFDKKAEDSSTDSFRKVARFLDILNTSSVDLFTKFNVESIFDMRLAAVDTRFRRNKIGYELCRRSVIIAEEKNYKVVKAEATAYYSQRMLSDLGFKVINEIIYDQYLDEFGKPVFNVEPPHKSAQLMYKVLN